MNPNINNTVKLPAITPQTLDKTLINVEDLVVGQQYFEVVNPNYPKNEIWTVSSEVQIGEACYSWKALNSENEEVEFIVEVGKTPRLFNHPQIASSCGDVFRFGRHSGIFYECIYSASMVKKWTAHNHNVGYELRNYHKGFSKSKTKKELELEQAMRERRRRTKSQASAALAAMVTMGSVGQIK